MKTISLRRVIGMIIGVIIISLGIAIFKESHLGNDSISALNLRIADLRGVSFGVQNMTINVVFLIIEFIFGRKYIGLGTLVNGIGVGYIVTFFSGYLTQWFGTLQSLPVQLLFVVLGVLVTSLGASLYQTADLGIAPYDYLSLGLRDYTPFPYFGCRIVTDALCALLTFLLGGLVGIVTDVGLNYATVRSIIDDESRVSAMGIQSSDTCIVAGDLTLFQEGRLRITDMKKDAVIQDGDRIVTSNISSKFVPGILIGYAVDVHDDEKHLMKNGYLIPAADFDDMSEVLVITEVKADSFKDTNDGSDVAVSDGTAAAPAPAVETSGEDAATEESETTAPAESSPAASSLVESLSQSYQGAQASQDTETQGEAGGLTPEQISEYERNHPETEEDTAASGNGTASGEGSQ